MAKKGSPKKKRLRTDEYDPFFDEVVANRDQSEEDKKETLDATRERARALPEFSDSRSLSRAAATPQSEDQYADAWYAEYGTAVSRAIIGRPHNLQELVAEVVIDHDDRKQKHDTTGYPYRCVCSLVITAANGKRFIGTGWLAGPRTVVTAGHCVYMRRQGGWARQIDVYPGRNGDSKPIEARSEDLRSVQGWVTYARPESDYGAIILPETFTDHNAGYFGFSTCDAERLGTDFVYLYGYPGDQPTGTMWGHCRQVKRLRRETLVYDIDTYGGNSGGPVFLIEEHEGKQRSYVVGIHNYGDLTGNSATRITERVFANLKSWKYGA